MLDFQPGERLKNISVTIVDNPVPELDKQFRLELYNPDGGGREDSPSRPQTLASLIHLNPPRLIDSPSYQKFTVSHF